MFLKNQSKFICKKVLAQTKICLSGCCQFRKNGDFFKSKCLNCYADESKSKLFSLCIGTWRQVVSTYRRNDLVCPRSFVRVFDRKVWGSYQIKSKIEAFSTRKLLQADFWALVSALSNFSRVLTPRKSRKIFFERD